MVSIVDEHTIYVGNLDSKVTREMLYELFVQFGPIIKIRYPKDKISQQHQGFAFIEYFTEDDVKYVQNVVNDTVKLFDKTLRVRPAYNDVNKKMMTQSTDETAKLDLDIVPVAKVFMKNIDDSVDSSKLYQIFQKYGPQFEKPDIFLLSNGNLRCAHIFFKRYEDADLAIKSLDNQFVVNQRVHLEYAFKPDSVQKSSRYGERIDRFLNSEAWKNGTIV